MPNQNVTEGDRVQYLSMPTEQGREVFDKDPVEGTGTVVDRYSETKYTGVDSKIEQDFVEIDLDDGERHKVNESYIGNTIEGGGPGVAVQPLSENGGGGGGGMDRPDAAMADDDGETAVAGDGERIDAEMQGTILSVDVDVGDEVAPGDVVLVLEAMKMENDIVAESGGTVSEVLVSEGESVDMGDPLIVIE